MDIFIYLKIGYYSRKSENITDHLKAQQTATILESTFLQFVADVTVCNILTS